MPYRPHYITGAECECADHLQSVDGVLAPPDAPPMDLVWDVRQGCCAYEYYWADRAEDCAGPTVWLLGDQDVPDQGSRDGAGDPPHPVPIGS